MFNRLFALLTLVFLLAVATVGAIDEEELQQRISDFKVQISKVEKQGDRLRVVEEKLPGLIQIDRRRLQKSVETLERLTPKTSSYEGQVKNVFLRWDFYKKHLHDLESVQNQSQVTQQNLSVYNDTYNEASLILKSYDSESESGNDSVQNALSLLSKVQHYISEARNEIQENETFLKEVEKVDVTLQIDGAVERMDLQAILDEVRNWPKLILILRDLWKSGEPHYRSNAFTNMDDEIVNIGKPVAYLKAGDLLKISFQIPVGGEYFFRIRYSNDNFGECETLSLRINDDFQSFESQDTSKETDRPGSGWDIYVESDLLGPFKLNAGEIKAEVSVSGGDNYGIEISQIGVFFSKGRDTQ